MAAMPWAGGSFPRAFITNAEKAKKTPATSRQPSADRSVTTSRMLAAFMFTSHPFLSTRLTCGLRDPIGANPRCDDHV